MPFLEEKCTYMTRPLAARPACKEGGFTSCCGGNVRGSCAVEGDPSGSDAPVMAAVGIEGGWSSMGNPSRHQLGVEMKGKAMQRTIRDALF